nr:pyridoxamine 5'-phosphate oxidase family protein [Prevotella sp.]
MTKEEIVTAINKHPVFYLATTENNIPHVRGMLLYRATMDELIFHTARCKELPGQISKNNNVEMCFNADGVQIRINGKAELMDNKSIKDEIAATPSRAFIKKWKDSVPAATFYNEFLVYHVTKGKINLWTMDRNLEPKIELEY